MVRWKNGRKTGGKKKKKKGKAAPYHSKIFQTSYIQIFLRNAARRTNSCSKYDIRQVHLFSFTESRTRFLVVQLGQSKSWINAVSN